MDEFKEWLENSYVEILNDLKQEQNNDGCSYLNGKQNFCLNTIVEYEKYHPTTKKLSEIIENIKNFDGEDLKISITYQDNQEYGYYEMEISAYDKLNDVEAFRISVSMNSKKIEYIISDSWYQQFSDWLYQLKLDETEIIIDVDEVK